MAITVNTPFFGVNRFSKLVLTAKAPRIKGFRVVLALLALLAPKKHNLRVL